MHRDDHRDPSSAASSSATPSRERLRAAFRELHGTRLHGFALLLTLGDRRRAAVLSADALAAAEARAPTLRHPERAAAWLRARVTGRVRGRGSPIDADERLAALAPLGVTAPVLAGLASLERRERAALIAAWVERIHQRDVATIVGREGNRLDSLLRRARGRYLEAYATVPPDPTAPRGPIGEMVHATASRAMS